METGLRIISYIRRHLVFSLCTLFFYYQSGVASNPAMAAIYVVAVIVSVVAIVTPRHLRTVPYYVSVAAGMILLALATWLTAVPHHVPISYYIAAIALLATTPNRLVPLGAILSGVILVVLLLLSAHPDAYWATLGYCGLYLGIRNKEIRAEAEEMQKRYVEELEVTLTELKSAHHKLETDAAQSMHYAAQAERARIARDIHDGIGHQLTSLIVQLQALSYMLPHHPDEAAKRIPSLVEVARTGLSEVRRAVRTWEAEEDAYGLTALLAVVEEARSTSGLEITFETAVGDHGSLPDKIKITLYRVLQETLTNAIRHSKSTHVDVRVAEQDGEVQLTVNDNGTCAQPDLQPGFGLRNMAARCVKLGGQCTWIVRPDHGVTIKAVLPLEAADN